MAVVSTLNAWNDTAIFDETAHIGASYSYVAKQEIRLNPEHPPLIKNLAGLPLLFLNLNFDTNQPFWTGELPGKWDEGQWASGRHLLYGAGNDPDKIIFWSRMPIVLLSLLLGWFIFRWTRALAGISAGLFALALYAFDPNILGHNHFVTTDLGIAAFFTFAFYFYLKFIKEPSWKNVALAGLFLGLLQLTKFSFMIALPILALATVIYPLTKRNRDSKEKSVWRFKLKKLAQYCAKGFLVFLFSLVVVWALYFLNTLKMSRETVAKAIDFNFPPGQTQNIKEVYTRKVLHGLNENAITRPLAIFGEGIGYVFRRVAGGNGAYFMQEVSSTAFPAYFPTVFAIKEPLAILFFMLLAVFLSFGNNFRGFFRSFQAEKKMEVFSDFIRHNIIVLSMSAFVFLYAYVSVTGNLNIGFRHLFPILPFAYILTAKVLFDFLGRISSPAKKIWGTAFAALILFLVSGTVAAYPYYMSYFNQTAGGPKNGYKYVTDSNADWGQDMRRLKEWVELQNKRAGYKECFIEYHSLGLNNTRTVCKEPIEKIRVNYFGAADPKYYLGKDRFIDWWDSKRPIEPGWYAISVNSLQGSLYDKQKKDEDSYRWLKNIQPVAQVGTSIFIYYVTLEDTQRISNSPNF